MPSAEREVAKVREDWNKREVAEMNRKTGRGREGGRKNQKTNEIPKFPSTPINELVQMSTFTNHTQLEFTCTFLMRTCLKCRKI